MIPVPSICETVHYRSYGTPKGEFTSMCRAAIVAGTDGEKADLVVFNPTGLFFNPCSYGFDGGQWHYQGEC